MSWQGGSPGDADALGALPAAVGSEPQQLAPTPMPQHEGLVGMEGFADSEDQNLCFTPVPAATTEPAAPLQQVAQPPQLLEQPAAQPAEQQEQQQQEAPGQQATSQAARLYVKESKACGVEVHPTVVARYNSIPDELVRSCNPWEFPESSAGGAMVPLSGIPGLSSQQLLAALRAVLGGDETYVRRPLVLVVHHMDLSGVQLGTEALKYLLNAGSITRLAFWFPLQTLELAECGLGSEQFEMLYRATQVLRRLKRLELRGNDFQAETYAQVCMVHQLFVSAPLQYLGLENTGISSQALDWMLQVFLSPRSQQAQEHFKGTLPHLQVLRLGPPSDTPLLSELSAGLLLTLLEAAPQLQGLVVHGLSEEHQEALAAKWAKLKGEEATFCGQLGEQKGFRLSIKPLGEVLPAEVPPMEHTLPGPQTPPQQQAVGERSPVDDGADFLGRPAAAESDGGFSGGIYQQQLPASLTPAGTWAAPGSGLLSPVVDERVLQQQQQQMEAAKDELDAGGSYGRHARGAEAHKNLCGSDEEVSEDEEGAQAGGWQLGKPSGEAATQENRGHSRGSASSGGGGGGGSRCDRAHAATTVKKFRPVVESSDDDEQQ